MVGFLIVAACAGSALAVYIANYAPFVPGGVSMADPCMRGIPSTRATFEISEIVCGAGHQIHWGEAISNDGPLAVEVTRVEWPGGNGFAEGSTAVYHQGPFDSGYGPCCGPKGDFPRETGTFRLDGEKLYHLDLEGTTAGCDFERGPQVFNFVRIHFTVLGFERIEDYELENVVFMSCESPYPTPEEVAERIEARQRIG